MIDRSIDELERRFRDITSDLDGFAVPGGDSDDPRMLLAAGEQLFEVCRRIEREAATGGEGALLDQGDLSEIGDYGMQLFSELAARAAATGREGQALALEDLTLPFAIWLAHRGAELRMLQPVVNALARYANSVAEPRELGALAGQAERIVSAASAEIRQDMDNTNLQRPWRILLMNWAIIATRSHDTGRMERAFSAFTASLPGDAAQFFAEGMKQMGIIDYPPAVRELMQRYHETWSARQGLH